MAADGEGDAKDQVTLYELVGGRGWFEDLVDRFYDGVADDPVLRPLYPEADLSGARQRLCGFLVQYWGGPDDYSRARGHPRLRLRHQPYPIDPPRGTAGSPTCGPRWPRPASRRRSNRSSSTTSSTPRRR